MGNENSGRSAWVWTEKVENDLRRLWASGESAAVIGAHLGVSRSAVLGKARRLHLALRRGDRERKPHTETKVPRVPRAPKEPKPSQRAPLFARPEGNAWDPVPGTVPLPLLDLQRGQCKWPVSQDAPFLFCAAPAEEGRPYCAHHHLWAVGRGTASERDAVGFAKWVGRKEQEAA
jgi:GcrA cell cycle regulator